MIELTVAVNNGFLINHFVVVILDIFVVPEFRFCGSVASIRSDAYTGNTSGCNDNSTHFS
jgi:hypothetical protein